MVNKGETRWLNRTEVLRYVKRGEASIHTLRDRGEPRPLQAKLI